MAAAEHRPPRHLVMAGGARELRALVSMHVQMHVDETAPMLISGMHFQILLFNVSFWLLSVLLLP